ncbi:beta-lactoglobulin [Sapajus apella]|uniref:Beta-lactoglobulin n=1 Tax=Sapajus apella TaxID=9515 RepID=A0A6J3GK91_SAPAP|nr:beta-lactoglobulin [Sapajus apella]
MALETALLLLLALGLDLAGAQKALEEVPVQWGFDAHKVEGRWFTLQLAASRAELVSPADPLRLALHSIRTSDRGDVDFVLFWKGEGVCQEKSITVHPTQLQGQYQGSFEGSSMHVRFVSTDYSNLILYVRFEDDEVTSLWVLLARRVLEDPTWLGRYLEFVEKFQLQRAPAFNIDGPCAPPRA